MKKKKSRNLVYCAHCGFRVGGYSGQDQLRTPLCIAKAIPVYGIISKVVDYKKTALCTVRNANNDCKYFTRWSWKAFTKRVQFKKCLRDTDIRLGVGSNAVKAEKQDIKVVRQHQEDDKVKQATRATATAASSSTEGNEHTESTE